MPDGFVAAEVAQRMRLNGIPIAINAVAASGDAQRACARVAEHWSLASGTVVLGCRRNGDWSQVTRRVGFFEETMQLHDSPSGATGYVSHLDLRNRPSRLPTPRIPLPVGSRTLGVLQSAGPGGEVVQFTLSVPVPPAAALRRLADDARRLGWTIAEGTDRSPLGGMVGLHRGNADIQAIATAIGPGSGLVLVEHGPRSGQP